MSSHGRYLCRYFLSAKIKEDKKKYIIQSLPLCKGNMMICSPEAGNCPRAILPASGEQIVMLPSHKGNNCFIMPIYIFSLQCEKSILINIGFISFAVKLLRVYL